MRWVWLLCAFLVSAEGAHAQTLTFEGDFEMEPENNTTETSQGAVKSNESVDETSTARTERTPIKLPTGGVLYPRASENRDVKSLDGFWHFKLDSMDQEGLKEQWFDKDISQMPGATLMPVPSSYNDITTLASVRDHVGMVWYQRTFYIPQFWKQDQRVWLRFGSAHYYAQVWVNSKKVFEHEIGHLPFQGEITDVVNFGGENNITVAVDNVLSSTTIPQGNLHVINTTNGPKTFQQYSFDFFNYAGIHRPVYLYTTPKAYIDDVLLTTEFQNGKVYVNYNLFYKGAPEKSSVNITVTVISREGERSYESAMIEDGPGNVSGAVEIQNPKLWWPYLMASDPGYLYTVELKLTVMNSSITDVYRQPFGLRSLKWDQNSVYINEKPIYIRGFGRHEDSDIRGKGLDLPTSMRDHNLLRWIGANAYRTSHYPYAEEIMDLAEQMGFMIIDEVPSVDTENYSQTLLDKHKMAMAELINRDKNRASVIMWSVANEPRTSEPQAGPYFGEVVKFVKSIDHLRPVTAVIATPNSKDEAGQWMDVICFNRYNGWYSEPGRWQTIQLAVETEANNWHEKHNKPVIMSEYGADTYEGLHNLPEYIWTEEYQKRVFSEHFKAFDNLRKKGWFMGEMIWNFADFKTDQSITRVGGNKKGVFTRQRQPKSAAFYVRRRNFKLAALLDGAPQPDDLELYFAPSHRDEL
ncbi:beta-glucuronidase isoform X2 [Macrosteles quadrilineatus]|uniref:beta-glucuronidase isoform X2 n=1 Tax=Macrosteles quadrilineatus TaxID=74068 RepID=UPI0023E271D0|nr:beta-glucuronidase isoform X2 [Macrosteles quadrilineatus]